MREEREKNIFSILSPLFLVFRASAYNYRMEKVKGRAKGHYFKFTSEQLAAAVKESVHVTDLASKLGRKGTAGLKEYVEREGLDISHWTRGKHRFHRTPYRTAPARPKVPIEEILTISNKRRSNIRTRIIEENILPYVCIECGQLPLWNGKSLSLHLDHINGDGCDNRIENLRFLCPNCHTQTATYCSKNRHRKKTCV